MTTIPIAKIKSLAELGGFCDSLTVRCEEGRLLFGVSITATPEPSEPIKPIPFSVGGILGAMYHAEQSRAEDSPEPYDNHYYVANKSHLDYRSKFYSQNLLGDEAAHLIEWGILEATPESGVHRLELCDFATRAEFVIAKKADSGRKDADELRAHALRAHASQVIRELSLDQCTVLYE